MLNLQIRTSIFGNFENINLEESIYKKLFNLFISEGLYPGTSQEYNMITGQTFPRPQFTNPQKGMILNIGINRIDFEIQNLNERDVVAFEQLTYSLNQLKRLMDAFDLKGTRLAINSSNIKKSSRDETCKIYKSLVKTPSFYNDPSLVEEWRINQLIRKEENFATRQEQINVITLIGEAKNTQNPSLVEWGLLLDFDINTSPDNNTPRFIASDLDSFLDLAKSYMSEIMEEYNTMIDGIIKDE